jgi:hypothetical protein
VRGAGILFLFFFFSFFLWSGVISWAPFQKLVGERLGYRRLDDSGKLVVPLHLIVPIHNVLHEGLALFSLYIDGNIAVALARSFTVKFQRSRNKTRFMGMQIQMMV